MMKMINVKSLIIVFLFFMAIYYFYSSLNKHCEPEVIIIEKPTELFLKPIPVEFKRKHVKSSDGKSTQIKKIRINTIIAILDKGDIGIVMGRAKSKSYSDFYKIRLENGLEGFVIGNTFRLTKFRPGRELPSDDERQVISELLFENYDEKNLLWIYRFFESPNNYYNKFREIPDIFKYFRILDKLAEIDERYDFYTFDSYLKMRIEPKYIAPLEIETLAYLLLDSDETYRARLIKIFVKQFKESNIFFVQRIPKDDWLKILKLIEGKDWVIFKGGVNELRYSGIYAEFKQFVLEYEKNR